MSDWDNEHIEPDIYEYGSSKKLFDIDLIAETKKAYRIAWNKTEFWVPKSQCKLFYGKSTITARVKKWILDKNKVKY